INNAIKVTLFDVITEIDDDVDDAEIIHPYEEADPLNRPPPDLDTEPEAVAAAPTPAGKNLDTLYSKVKTLARQMKDRFDIERVDSEEFQDDAERALYYRETAEYHRYRFARVPYDPSTDPSLLLRSDDPYVMARDAVADPARDDDDDSAAPKDPQPSQPHGSPSIAQDRATRGNTSGASGSRGNTDGSGGQGGAPPARECTFTGFMKCDNHDLSMLVKLLALTYVSVARLEWWRIWLNSFRSLLVTRK
ncbi:hypothetical protein Tco_1441743, partial [Tanacetum coccineum]